MSTFKEKFCKENTLQQRKNESSKILKKFSQIEKGLHLYRQKRAVQSDWAGLSFE